MFYDIIYFILYVFIKTLIDIISLFGQIIIFGFLLYTLASLTRGVFAKTLGPKAELYITGWIGTPVHEISHAIFCILFNHKIDDMKLFTTKSNTIGYVLHSYDSRSWYQQAGNFFIGVGPIIIGTVIIYFLLFFLTPEIKNDVFNGINLNNIKSGSFSINSIKNILEENIINIVNIFLSSIEIIKNTVTSVIRNNSFRKISFWIFLYLAVSIASHMELSPADISHAWKGIIVIFAVLLILNTLFVFFNLILKTNIPLILYTLREKIIETSTILLLFASVVSLFNFIISYIVLTPVSLIKKKSIINPFA